MYHFKTHLTKEKKGKYKKRVGKKVGIRKFGGVKQKKELIAEFLYLAMCYLPEFASCSLSKTLPFQTYYE